MKTSAWKGSSVVIGGVCSFLEYRWERVKVKFVSIFVIYLLQVIFANLDLPGGGANSLLLQVGNVSGFEGCTPLKVVSSLMR